MGTAPGPPRIFHVERFAENPIIRPGMPGLEGELGNNINGPSLIRAPVWVENPLGKYYLYFAHHGGKFIRLAYADRLNGPGAHSQSGRARGPGTAAGPPVLSRYGAARGRVRQVRDPAVYAEDGRLYLLYSVAGEQGIAIARLVRRKGDRDIHSP